MENKEAMFQAFKIHGALAIGTYIRRLAQLRPNISTDEVKQFSKIVPLCQTTAIPPVCAKISRFVGSRAEVLFTVPDAPAQPSLIPESEDEFAVVPPFETFLKLAPNIRLVMFFNNLRLYDVFICEAINKKEVIDSIEYCIMPVVCFCNGKQMQIDDFKYMVAVKIDGDPEPGTLVKGVYVTANMPHRRMILATKMEDVPEAIRNPDVKLGIVTEKDLPPHYKLMKMNEIEQRPVRSFLNINEVHTKPGYYSLLNCRNKENKREHRLSLLYEAPSGPIPETELVSFIAEKRIRDLAHIKLQKAVSLYNKKKFQEALALCQECLQIWPNHKEALLYCNYIHGAWQNYEAAIEFCEKVLAIDEKNERAQQFLCKNLKHAIKKCQEDGDHDNAFIYCKKLLSRQDGEELTTLVKYLLQRGSHYFWVPSWCKFGILDDADDDKDNDNESKNSSMEVEETGEGTIEVAEPLSTHTTAHGLTPAFLQSVGISISSTPAATFGPAPPPPPPKSTTTTDPSSVVKQRSKMAVLEDACLESARDTAPSAKGKSTSKSEKASKSSSKHSHRKCRKHKTSKHSADEEEREHSSSNDIEILREKLDSSTKMKSLISGSQRTKGSSDSDDGRGSRISSRSRERRHHRRRHHSHKKHYKHRSRSRDRRYRARSRTPEYARARDYARRDHRRNSRSSSEATPSRSRSGSSDSSYTRSRRRRSRSRDFRDWRSSRHSRSLSPRRSRSPDSYIPQSHGPPPPPPTYEQIPPPPPPYEYNPPLPTYNPPLPPVPVDVTSGASYSTSAKDSALKIMHNIIDSSSRI